MLNRDIELWDAVNISNIIKTQTLRFKTLLGILKRSPIHL